jgi:transposase
MIGIDIGKKWIDVARHIDGKHVSRYPHTKISTAAPDWREQLLTFIQPAAGRVAVLEPTGWHLSRPIIEALQAAGARVFEVTHATSAQIRRAHLSQKTDANDSRGLAHIAWMVERGDPLRGIKQVSGSDNVLNLRLLLNRLTRLKRDSVRAQNRIRAYCHAVEPSAKPMHIVSAARALDGRMKKQNYPVLAERLKQRPVLLNEIIGQDRARLALDELAEDTERKIAIAAQAWPVAALWSTVPNYTPIYAAALLVATDGAPENLDRDQFTAAVGRYPQHQHSGDGTSSKWSRAGYRPAVNAVFTWSLGLLSPTAKPNHVRDYYAGGKKSGGKSFPNAQSKLCRILSAMARNGTPYHPPTKPDELCPHCGAEPIHIHMGIMACDHCGAARATDGSWTEPAVDAMPDPMPDALEDLKMYKLDQDRADQIELDEEMA